MKTKPNQTLKEKTLLDLEIDKANEILWRQTQTKWYDAGSRDVLLEGYLKGLEKARRLVRKQARKPTPKGDLK